MQTTFTSEQLQDPDTRTSERILRTCVHCGFCTATCPTYQLLGDELDGPRGRIYLIKQVVEGQPATAATQAQRAAGVALYPGIIDALEPWAERLNVALPSPSAPARSGA